jgi:hypothetical protein
MDCLNKLLIGRVKWPLLSLLASVFLLSAAKVSSQDPFQVSEYNFDFGYVGIEYKIYHTYTLKNTRHKPFTIDSVKINCDCTTVLFDKKMLNAGETVDFRLTFDTKDFYGPVNRSFQVFIGLPEKRVLYFFYKAHVGQWMNGIKPDPFAVFMLPTQKEQIVKISNKFFDELKVGIAAQSDSIFVLEVRKGKAGKDEQMEISVKPSENLTKGTYLSNFTLKITGEEADKTTYLTIPVKIARF